MNPLSFPAPQGCPDWFVDFTSRFDQIPAALMLVTLDVEKLEPWATKDDLRRQIQKAGRHAAAGILGLLCGWQQHREAQGEGPWVPATEESLVSNFGFGLFKRGKIREALKVIKELGLVSWRKLGPRVPTRYRVNREAIKRRLEAVWALHRPFADPEPETTPPTQEPPVTPPPATTVAETPEAGDEPDELDLMIAELAVMCSPPTEDTEYAPPQPPEPRNEAPRTPPKPSRPVTQASKFAMPTPPRDRDGIKQWVEQVDLGDSVQVDLAIRLLKQVYRNHPAPHAILAGLDPWAFKEPWSLVNFEWDALYKKFGRDRKRTLGDPNPTEASVAKYLYNQLVDPAKYADWAKFGTNMRVFQDWCVANGHAERPQATQETASAGKPRDIYLQPDRAPSRELETEAQMVERIHRLSEAKSIVNLESIMAGMPAYQCGERVREMFEGVIDVDFTHDGSDNVIAKLWKIWPTSN